MSKPHIHRKANGGSANFTGSQVLEELGNALCRIRQEDRLTWADMDVVLGKSDRAAHYADGSATMDVVTYYRARAHWNGRFTGGADRLLEAHELTNGHSAQSAILRTALALATALEDGELTDEEIRGARSSLENARDAIDGLLQRLSPRSAA